MYRKAKVSVGVGEWAWLSPISLLYFYCNLVCELLHTGKPSTPGYTTIFKQALLIDPILCGYVFFYPKSFVCLFIPSFF